MSKIITGIDFHEIDAQKYWQPPSTWSHERRTSEVRNRIFSGEWLGARKMDGAFYRFIKDENGEMELTGRSKGVGGDYIDKLDHVPHLHDFFNSLPNGTCVLGELYFPTHEGSSEVTKIMGCLTQKAIERQSKGDKLHYYIFDVLALDGKSMLDATAATRFSTLGTLDVTYGADCVEFAHYMHTNELWEGLMTILETGGEGIVMTRAESKYQPGKRPSKDCMKVKKELANTIDCLFTGKTMPSTELYEGKEIETWKYWQNIVTGEFLPEGEHYGDHIRLNTLRPVTKPFYHGWAGSLEIGVVKGDKVVPIGWLSGLTEEIKANPEKYKGRCIEVTAMELLPTGGLRHAKMVQFRDDLRPTDCTWEKVFGE